MSLNRFLPRKPFKGRKVAQWILQSILTWDPHGGSKEQTPASYPVTSMGPLSPIQNKKFKKHMPFPRLGGGGARL